MKICCKPDAKKTVWSHKNILKGNVVCEDQESIWMREITTFDQYHSMKTIWYKGEFSGIDNDILMII